MVNAKSATVASSMPVVSDSDILESEGAATLYGIVVWNYVNRTRTNWL